MSDEALLGTFEEQVMLAVLAAGGDAYGMQVRRELERATERDIAIGAVYATLDRLEAKKLVRSTRSLSAAAASRRLFTVSPAGARALTDTRAMRERLWRGVETCGDWRRLPAGRGRASGARIPAQGRSSGTSQSRERAAPAMAGRLQLDR